MTPTRFKQIKTMLGKKYPTPSDMIEAREAAKELFSFSLRLWRWSVKVRRFLRGMKQWLPAELEDWEDDDLQELQSTLDDHIDSLRKAILGKVK